MSLIKHAWERTKLLKHWYPRDTGRYPYVVIDCPYYSFQVIDQWCEAVIILLRCCLNHSKISVPSRKPNWKFLFSFCKICSRYGNIWNILEDPRYDNRKRVVESRVRYNVWHSVPGKTMEILSVVDNFTRLVSFLHISIVRNLLYILLYQILLHFKS